MNGGLWYEQSLRWTPTAPVSENALKAWWASLLPLNVPTRLLISTAVHRALQHRSLTWPTAVRHLDTLLTTDDEPTGLTGWTSTPPSWGWLWRAPLRAETRPPTPGLWPSAPTFKAELVANPQDAWPHAGAWWLHWAAQDALQAVPLDVWLDERDGLTPDVLRAWDRWVSQVGRLAGRTGWPVKPWAPDADEPDDPRWNPRHHHVWFEGSWEPDPPFWSGPGPESSLALTMAPCERCAAARTCPGPQQPPRWATPEGLCSQGRSWRVAQAGTV